MDFKKLIIRFSALDPRSLSLCRISLGIIIFLDTSYRIVYASDFLSEQGIWPQTYVKTFGWQPGFWSLFLLGKSNLWMYFLLLTQLILSLLFIIGIGKKITQFLVWILLVSVQNRNLFILQSGDDLMRIFLFFGLFTDMFSGFSIPFKPSSLPYNRKFYPGNVLLIVQLFCLYMFTVILKLQGSDWIPDGTAVYYALSIDQIRYPTGNILLNHPLCMKILSYLTFLLELVISLFLLIPFHTSFFRKWAFIFIIFLHLGFALTLKIGFFPFISMACGTILIPSEWWEKLSHSMPFLRNNHLTPEYPFCRSFVPQFIVCLVIASQVIQMNLSTLPFYPFESSEPVKYIMNFFRLNQYWGMFSPDIPKNDGWYEAWGRKPNGERHVLEAPDKSNPGKKISSLYRYFPTDRWRKLTENLSREEYTFLRPLFCIYLLKKYAKEIRQHGLQGMELVYFRELNRRNYSTDGPQRELWCYCIPHTP